MSAPVSSAQALPALSQQEKMLAFSGILTVLFLSSLNMTVVGTAMPRIISDLGGFALYTWAFTAYSLASTIAIPVVGTLSDMYGRRRLMLLAIAVFSLGAVALGCAQSMQQLIFFRALQGVGGGALMSLTFTAIADIFTPIERGRYQGYTGAVWGVSSVVGPLVGGFLTDHVGWRSVFFVNVPFALLAAYFIWRFFKMPSGGIKKKLDIGGALLLSVCVIPLMLAFSWGGSAHAWNSPLILALLALAVAAGAGYSFWQARAPAPVLNLRLLRERTFSVAAVAGLLTSAAMYAAILYLPLYMQGVKATSAAGSGLTLVPLMLGLIVASTLAGRWVSATGRYKPLILGGAVVAALALWWASTLQQNTSIWVATLTMVLLGVGLGPINSLLTLAIQNAVPRSELGSATSANQFFRQIGGTLAVALFGTLVNAHLARELAPTLPSAAAQLPTALQAAVASPALLTSPEAASKLQAGLAQAGAAGLYAPILDALRGVMVGAIDQIFLIAALMTALAVVSLALLPDRRLQGGAASAPGQAERPIAAD